MTSYNFTSFLKSLFLVGIVMFILTPLVAFAQDAVAAAGTPIMDQLLPLLITAIVPIMIALTKWFLPAMPKWLPPVLAPVLGLVLSYIQAMVTQTGVNPLTGAIYGALGVYLREIVDQMKKLAQPPSGFTPVQTP